jgi:predicted Zn-dependent peptidase
MREEINETRLRNGLVVLTDRMPGVRSATLGFFFRVGARHEPRELNGISHFIEHTVFKGTHRRSAFDIAIEQERLGGALDAFTTHEETGFAIKVIDDQLPAAFDLIADMLSQPRFGELDLKSEQRVIIEEMKMIDDSPDEYLGEIFGAAYFPEHPLGLSIAGTPQTVRSFGHEITKKYFRETYTASNLVITAAGNVEHDTVLRLAERVFGGDGQMRTSSTPPPEPASPILLKQKRELEQAHFVLAAPMPSAADERRYAADLLASVVGGGTASRLWQKVREERGLAYSVNASTITYQDCGIFSISAGTSPEQVKDVVEIVIAEVSDVVRNGVAPHELDLARQQMTSSILLNLEDSAARAASLAHSEMVHGRQISVEEVLDRVASVSLEEVHSLAADHFKTEKVAFAALGDLNGTRITREDLRI